MNFTIGNDCDGTLLRTYLTVRIGLSSRLLSRLKQKEDGILLNGVRVTVRAVLHAGDVLTLGTEDGGSETSTNVLPTDLPLSVLFEDDDLLVCNKSGDMPTHPSHGHRDDTLANAVAFYERQKTGSPGVFRPVNRLDRGTSGAVLIARNQLAASRLSAALRDGRIRKTYLALLCGVPDQHEGEIRGYIRRREESIIFRESCAGDAPGAARAITRYRVLAEWETYPPGTASPLRLSLVEASPLTGRTHQLRVHFSTVGTPILGDGLYGVACPSLIARHALHAVALDFPHPSTGERMVVRVPLPNDFTALIPPGVLTSVMQSYFDKESL